VVAECAVSSGIVFVAARQSGDANVDIAEVARQIIGEAGYADETFNPRNCSVMTSLGEIPSHPLIRDEDRMSDAEIDRIAAHNMANVFGFACRHTPELMPLPIALAHRLSRQLSIARRKRGLHYLAPDGKTQVAVEFRDGRPHRIHSVTVVGSHRGAEPPGLRRLRDDVIQAVIEPVFAEQPLQPDRATQLFVNPEGPYSGGPAYHSGMTGRKTAQDTYGEYARNGESALSGKDPTRIDRIGAYAARHAAKNVVAAGLADSCEVTLSYSIGLSQPVSVLVDTHGTGRIPDADIGARVTRRFDFRPAAIVRDYRLRELPSRAAGGFYRRLAAYGQVGRTDLDLPWERSDRVEALRE
jgi:S-adenosylmethionine synthetase